MFRQWLHRTFVSPRTVAGVEIRPDGAGNFVCDYVVLEQRSGKAEVVEKSAAPCTPEQLAEKLPRNIPVGLVVNGKGVLVKKGPGTGGEPGDVLAHLLPNLQIQEFAFQTLDLPDGQAFALMRAESLLACIRLLEERGFRVLAADLAFAGVGNFLAAFREAPQPLPVAKWLLTHESGAVTGFQADGEDAPEQALPGGSDLHTGHILAFSAALGRLLDTDTGLQNLPSLDSARREYRHEKLFLTGGIAFLALLLLGLLANTLFYFNYQDRLGRQALVLARHERQLAYLDSLQRLYQERQRYIGSTGGGQPGLSAWYADQIGASVPEGIRLTALQVNPAEKAGKFQDKELHFQSGVIRIKGISRQSTDLNRWLKALKALDWVREVQVLPYSENRTGVGEFELELWLTGSSDE